MKRTLIVTAAALATVSSLAVASAFAANTQAGNNTQTGNLQQQMLSDLQQSGFSNVKVVPGSFYVHAKDQAGNPVSMFITPDSMSEVTTIGNAGSRHLAANTPNSQDSAGMFATLPNNEELSSKIVGSAVYSKDNKDVGRIQDIAIANNGEVRGYIVSVGGFLGIDDHYVAVRPAAVDLSYNANENRWLAKIDVNAAQLKNAPAYKYPTRV